jgi:hypothetical protein
MDVGAVLRVAVAASFGLAACGRGPGLLRAPSADDAGATVSAVCVAAADPTLQVPELMMGSPGLAYDDEARVVSSTTERLVLALHDDLLTVRGAPAPRLPEGRIAWVRYLVSGEDTFGLRESTWALSVRTTRTGPLLFGVSHQNPGETLTPFALGALTTLCSFGACPRTSELALAVPGAVPPTIPTGSSATIDVGGKVFVFSVHAERQTFGDACDAGDMTPLMPIWLSYVATDLDRLAAQLGTKAPVP